jgi:hypothetical protein
VDAEGFVKEVVEVLCCFCIGVAYLLRFHDGVSEKLLSSL